MAGQVRDAGEFVNPLIGAGQSATLTIPELPGAATEAHSWLTVSAELAEDAPWASAGHVVSTAQARLDSCAPARPRFTPSEPRAAGS